MVYEIENGTNIQMMKIAANVDTLCLLLHFRKTIVLNCLTNFQNHNKTKIKS